MTQDQILLVISGVAVLGLVVLASVADVLLNRAKAARSARVLKVAAERAREANLMARYRRAFHEPAVDMDALQAELDADFPLSARQG